MTEQSVGRNGRGARGGPRVPRSPEAQRRQQDILRMAMDTFAARGYNNA
ncbi:hypothetical protein [Streptomyces sp. ME109]|nr:hypothetical protein [Streptomyces sp. me109]